MPLSESSFRPLARSLAIDLATGEVVSRLRHAGIEAIVLRGPAIARRLYAPGEARPYVDLDLLVDPAEEAAAGGELADLGFAVVASEADLVGFRPVHAHEWVRERDGVAVDLHTPISGVGVDGEVIFSSLLAGSEPALVGGVEVNLPAPPAVALEVALHAAHHGPRREKSLRDLNRALERLPESVGRDAAQLAEALDAVPAFVAGLSLGEGGVARTAALELATDVPLEVKLRASGAPPLALGIDWLASTPGTRAKATLLVRTLVPRPGALRSWRPLARRRPFGLALAYVSHPLWLAWHTVPSLLAVRRARKEAE